MFGALSLGIVVGALCGMRVVAAGADDGQAAMESLGGIQRQCESTAGFWKWVTFQQGALFRSMRLYERLLAQADEWYASSEVPWNPQLVLIAFPLRDQLITVFAVDIDEPANAAVVSATQLELAESEGGVSSSVVQPPVVKKHWQRRSTIGLAEGESVIHSIREASRNWGPCEVVQVPSTGYLQILVMVGQGSRKEMAMCGWELGLPDTHLAPVFELMDLIGVSIEPRRLSLNPVEVEQE